jgi:hypothetical protein
MRGDLQSAHVPNAIHGNSRRQKLISRATNEFRRFLVMFFYLWVLFGLFVLNERIILGHRGISLPLQSFAVLNALILAKIMLIADYFELGAWLRGRPLIYPIVTNSLSLSVLFICFHVIEKVVIGLVNGESLAQSVPAIGGFVPVLCVALILFVSLIPFFAFRFVSRELGTDRLNAMLFGTKIGDLKESTKQETTGVENKGVKPVE